MTIAQSIGDYSNPNSLGSKFRQRRSGPLREMIVRTFAKKGNVTILDVGGMEYYWDMLGTDFLIAHNVHITLLNLINDVRSIKMPQIFEAREGDGCKLPFSNNDFDICHSNSVIEHVGPWPRKSVFARESRRVARCYFIQTPNYWFPWEPHHGFLGYHWLPEPTRLWLSMHWKLGWAKKRASDVTVGMDAVEHATLLNYAMVRHLFPDATEIKKERLLGLTKSFVAIRAG